jgi:Tfp pilus assembly protein FimT
MTFFRTNRKTTRPAQRGPRAFSAIELTVTVFVIGVTAAITVPRYQSGMGKYRLENAARRLSTDIESMRQRATLLGAEQTIVFAEDGYKLYKRDGRGNITSELVEYTQEFYQSTVNWVMLSGNGDLTFNAFGMPVSGVLIRIDCQGKSRVVHVAGATGTSDATDVVTASDIASMQAAVGEGTVRPMAGRKVRSVYPAASTIIAPGEED